MKRSPLADGSWTSGRDQFFGIISSWTTIGSMTEPMPESEFIAPNSSFIEITDLIVARHYFETYRSRRSKSQGVFMVKFDANSISRLDWGVIGAGALALIALFLPWYGVSSGPFSASVTGWSTSYGWLGALLIIAAGAFLLLLRSQMEFGRLRFGPGVVVLGAASIGTIIVALRWLTLPSGHGAVGGITYYSYGPRVGIIITLIAGLVQVGCAYKLFRASGEAVPWATEKTTEPEVPPTSPA